MKQKIIILIGVFGLISTLTLSYNFDERKDIELENFKGSQYSKEIIEVDGMKFLLITNTWANDGFRIVNLTKDKAEIEYYKNN